MHVVEYDIPVEALRSWYRSPEQLNMGWLDHPSRHHVRWRGLDGRWIMAPRRFSSGAALSRYFGERPPADLYVSTSAWLDPVDLPSLRDHSRPAPVLLDHFVVFDLDLGPFSLRRLEEVRARTSRLVSWLSAHTDLDLVQVTFSGSKGFHVVLRDPDRTPFSIPDPGEREAAVREARKALLEEVMAAGHDVDPTVTADTRRIIRLPGSVHGATGWACTVLSMEQVHRPLKGWVGALPRLEGALKMPVRPRRVPRSREAAPKSTGGAKEDIERFTLEVSTHVSGTKDRTAIMGWIPEAVVRRRGLEAFLGDLPSELAPLAVFKVESRHLLVSPRAWPRPRAIALMESLGMNAIAARHRADDHAWIPLVETTSEATCGVAPLMLMRTQQSSSHPWSRPHLELCHRLGLTVPPGDGEVAGTDEPALRFARRR